MANMIEIILIILAIISAWLGWLTHVVEERRARGQMLGHVRRQMRTLDQVSNNIVEEIQAAQTRQTHTCDQHAYNVLINLQDLRLAVLGSQPPGERHD